MREILCRGKRLDNGEWVQGRSILTLITSQPEEMKIYIPQSGELFSAEESETTGNLYSINGTFYKVDPATVGEFTDLTDSNGSKIFEGDIVKLTDKLNGGEWYAQVVFGNPYSEYSWGWNFLYIGKKPQVNTDILLWGEMEEVGAYCEVIGNIHDNPELLKGGAENETV